MGINRVRGWVTPFPKHVKQLDEFLAHFRRPP